MTRTLTCLISLLACYSIGIAQSKNASPVQELEKYFEEAAKGKGYFISKENLTQISERQFKKIALPYLSSDQDRLRGEAIQLIKRKALLLYQRIIR